MSSTASSSFIQPPPPNHDNMEALDAYMQGSDLHHHFPPSRTMSTNLVPPTTSMDLFREKSPAVVCGGETLLKSAIDTNHELVNIITKLVHQVQKSEETTRQMCERVLQLHEKQPVAPRARAPAVAKVVKEEPTAPAKTANVAKLEAKTTKKTKPVDSDAEFDDEEPKPKKKPAAAASPAPAAAKKRKVVESSESEEEEPKPKKPKAKKEDEEEVEVKLPKKDLAKLAARPAKKPELVYRAPKEEPLNDDDDMADDGF